MFDLTEHHPEATQGVISMQDWETIRLRCMRDKEPIKRVARETGHVPNTIRRYLKSSTPPLKMTINRPAILQRYQAVIDQYIRDTPKITAKRIGDLLRRDYEPDLTVGESALRKFVAKRRTVLIEKESFIRAEYAPGVQAQFDFSPMRAIIGGIEQRLELFIMRLSYSGHMFACVSLREDLPALMSGMLSAFDYFGGLPATAVFDNAKTAVNHVLRGRERVENPAFLAFRGAIALEVQFAAPRRGNEKGGVEGAHGYVEDNFFRPMPSFLTIDEINDALRMFCTDNMKRIHATHRERIGDRFEREKTTLRPLPARLPDACVTTFAKINKFSEVHLRQR